MRKILILAVMSFLGFSSIQAQDIHFSQFYLSPLTLNPALTGVFNCTGRLTATYRNQWASALRSNAFSTYSASYDHKIPVGRSDYFGVGGTLWADKAGSLDFSTQQLKISGSYSKKMFGYRSRAHYLVLGAEAGVSQRSIDFLKAQWGTQFDGTSGVDPNAPSFEDWDRNNFVFADASAGILWFSVFDEHTNLYLGGAYSHLNRANLAFSESDLVEYATKITVHGGAEFPLGARMNLNPNAVALFQGKSMEVNTGMNFKFILGQSRSLYQAVVFGFYTRVANRLTQSTHMDAIILNARFDYEQFNIGFAYDLNTSSYKAASNGNGAFEFAVNYLFCGRENRGVYCPNF